ncbi:MAG: GNAT family protein [Thermomicrobiales bacterium]
MSATTETTKPAPVPGTGHQGQTFLVGDLVYIRAVETSDAEYAMWWRDSPFPLSPARVETLIKEEMPKERRAALMVVRKSDDVPVGALWVTYHSIAVQIDPRFGGVYGDLATPWLCEALTMVVPWLVDEQHRPVVHVRLAGHQTEAIAAIEAIGGRETARFRTTYFLNRERQDQVIVEYRNAQWGDRIGDPNQVELTRTGTGVARPVPARVVLEGDPPLNAVLVGQRVYLRPVEEKDGEAMTKLQRLETETFHDLGRRMSSAIGLTKWHDGLQKKDPPAWVRFAVCLRENDELIGAVGIDGIDRIHGFAESESELLNPAYRGQGYGSEAKHLLFEYAFNHLGLHSLQSFVLWDNTRSAAALRKQGYRDAGRLNWTYVKSGKYGDICVFDLLAEEWRSLPRE